jgi:hypothetical protein
LKTVKDQPAGFTRFGQKRNAAGEPPRLSAAAKEGWCPNLTCPHGTWPEHTTRQKRACRENARNNS